VGFAPDNSVGLVEGDNKLMRFDPVKGRPHPGMLFYSVKRRISWHPEGTRVLICSLNLARILDVTTFRSSGPTFPSSGRVAAMTWANGGKNVAVAGEDGTLSMWDAVTGHLVWQHRRHRDAVVALAVDPTGSMIVSIGNDGAAHLCEVATGRLLGPPLLPGGLLRTVAYSPDGSTFMTGGEAKQARLWHAPQPETGTARQLGQRIRSLLGMTLDDRGFLQVLDRDGWRAQAESGR
jgi:WD40 repeat protein